MYDIIFLKPRFIDKIWGSNKLEEFNKSFTNRQVGEVFLCDKESEILSFNCSLNKFYNDNPAFFGNFDSTDFPTLSKLIYANQNLSLQMHPQKNESWYVIKSDNGSIFLEREYSNDLLDQMISGNLENLTKIYTKKYERYDIAIGDIHSIQKGNTIFEFQNNDDITYRVYDYGRNRDLHINEVKTFFEETGFKKEEFNILSKKLNVSYNCIIDSDQINLNCPYWKEIFVINGSGKINNKQVSQGDYLLINKQINWIKFEGPMEILIIYLY